MRGPKEINLKPKKKKKPKKTGPSRKTEKQHECMNGFSLRLFLLMIHICGGCLAHVQIQSLRFLNSPGQLLSDLEIVYVNSSSVSKINHTDGYLISKQNIYRF